MSLSEWKIWCGCRAIRHLLPSSACLLLVYIFRHVVWRTCRNRISSSVLPENIEPHITSILPLQLVSCMWSSENNTMFLSVIFSRKSNDFVCFQVFSLFISTFYGTEKDMQALLNDIELDVQELKCLMQSISG